MLTFHATGDWAPGRLRVRRTVDGRRRVAEVERLIDQAWDRATAQPGVHLFDGPMCRLESFALAPDGALELALSETSYKPFLGTNLRNAPLADRYGAAVMANPVGVSPALETADGFLLLGRRNGSVAYYPDRIHPFAGALEPRDAGDLFAAVHRELSEELSLSRDDVPEVRCTGLVEDAALRQPELIFRARTALTRAQVDARLDRAEHDATWSVAATPPAVESALREPRLTPVAVASLLLWGRMRFGDGWFRQGRAGVADRILVPLRRRLRTER